MPSKESNQPSIIKIFSQTLGAIRKRPVVLAPFLISAIIESCALGIIFLSPRTPFKALFGPIIKTLWGERFLHYPANFILLPKLASLSKLALTVIFGSLLTGTAILIISSIYGKQHLKTLDAFKSALKKYVSLFAIVLVFIISLYFLLKIPSWALLKYFMRGHTRLLFINGAIWFGPILFSINFILTILIQSAFTYAVPILMIGGDKLLKSILKSFLLCKKLFIPTIILCGLPSLIYVPILIINSNPAFLISKFFPEIVLWSIWLGIIMSSVIIDSLVTISTTILYLQHRDKFIA